MVLHAQQKNVLCMFFCHIMICNMVQLVFILEIIGTIAFAISGAMVALQNKMDLFGVIALGVITATFGGIARDLLLGNIPPSAFIDPVYVFIAFLTSLFVFIIAYTNHRTYEKRNTILFQRILFIMDSVGLGIFTVIGAENAWTMYEGKQFLAVFSGLITGVGGGLLRDMVVNSLPDIFSRHIYAIASVAGALVSVMLFCVKLHQAGIWLGAIIIVLIRILAVHYHWQLPKIA